MNPFAIILASIASEAVGFFWYSQNFFGREWIKLSGAKMSEKMKKMEAVNYTKSFLVTVIEAFILSRFLSLANAHTLLEGAQVGFMAWLGFTATTMFADTLFKGKSQKLFYIETGYQMVSIMLMGAILALLS